LHGAGRYDPFIPEARAALWRSINATLVAAGIHMFWLDGNEIIGEIPWETPTAPLGPQIWAGNLQVPSRAIEARAFVLPHSRCGTVGEGGTLTLNCSTGSTIDQIGFASYGTPSGNCAKGFTAWPSCDDANTTEVAKHLCVGKSGCQLSASNFQFGGPDPCPNIAKHLSVLVHCSGDPPLPPLPPPPPPATLNCSTTGRNCPTEFSAGMNDEVGTFFPFMHQLTFAEGIQRDRLPPPAMMLSRAATAGSWRLGGASWDGDHHCEWTDYINHLCACIPLCHQNLVHLLYLRMVRCGVRAFRALSHLVFVLFC
jgi:alpha-glucosidase (family GH31 glycosyl hydrolase)